MIRNLLIKPYFLIPFVLSLASFLCYLTGLANVRWDLTQERKHSLTENSKKLLQSLSDPVAIRFYLSRADNSLPVKLRHYAERVDSLLVSVATASKGKVTITRLDPKIDPDAAESAYLDEITPQTLSSEALIYMGISLSSADRKRQFSYLDPAQDSALEYQLLRKIKEVSTRERSQLGLISSLPVSRPGEEWQFIKDLFDQYDIVPISAGDSIPENINTLLLIHPRGIKKKFNQKIDAFTKRGGSMIVIMDSASLALSFTPMGESIEDIISTWSGCSLATGLQFTGKKPVADMLFSTKLDRGEGFEDINTILSINEQGILPDHPITEGLSLISLPVAGAFVGEPHSELTVTPILQTTEQSTLSDTNFVMTATKNEMAKKHNSFQPDPHIYNIAVLLTGKLRSFTSGEIRQEASSSKVLLIGDSDFLADPYAGYSEQVQGNKAFVPINNNLGFLYNAIDFLENDVLLNDARAKTRQKRPLLKLREHERSIRSSYESRLAKLEVDYKTVLETGNHQNFIRQKGTIDFSNRQQESKRKAELRSLQAEITVLKREMREKIQTMKSQIQWLNILVIPALIGLSGIIFFMIRRHHTRVRAIPTSE